MKTILIEKWWSMEITEKKRAGLLDEVRGFAIICMVVYHFLFMLKRFHGVEVPVFFDDWFDYVWALFAGTFIFISGMVCRFSRNNIKRGAQCFFLGMVITFVTAIAAPNFAILFGILHFLGVCMMFYGLGEKVWDKISPLTGAMVCLFMFAITQNVAPIVLEDKTIMSGVVGIAAVPWLSVRLPWVLYDAGLLFPLGFYDPKVFGSGDYFPLFPWVFLFFAGSYLGVYVKAGKCPKFFYSVRVPFLAAAGRRTIWIYLLHQPIAMIFIYFFEKIFKI